MSIVLFCEPQLKSGEGFLRYEWELVLERRTSLHGVEFLSVNLFSICAEGKSKILYNLTSEGQTKSWYQIFAFDHHIYFLMVDRL